MTNFKNIKMHESYVADLSTRSAYFVISIFPKKYNKEYSYIGDGRL